MKLILQFSSIFCWWCDVRLAPDLCTSDYPACMACAADLAEIRRKCRPTRPPIPPEARVRRFNAAIRKHTPAGWTQYYFIIAEVYSGPCCGRWHYHQDPLSTADRFVEAEIFSMQSSPDSGFAIIRDCNEELLYREVEQDTVMLYRVPKQAYRQMFPEISIDY